MPLSDLPEHETAAEHIRNALAVLQSLRQTGTLDSEAQADLDAAVERLGSALGAIEPDLPATPLMEAPPPRGLVQAVVRLTWPTLCPRLATWWAEDRPLDVSALLTHWRTCATCQASARHVGGRVVGRLWKR